jgi:glycosyltransferase involved in cell wall biosynthesis
MKVAYVYEHDAADPAVQSTRPFSILLELKKRFDVVEIFPVPNYSKTLFFYKKLWYGFCGQRHHLDREPLTLREYAWRVGEAVERAKPDLVFSPSQIIPTFLKVDVPIIYCTDAPFLALIGYYEEYADLSDLYTKQVRAQEEESHRNAARVIYPSDWAAREAIRLYGVDPAKIAEQPFGANLPYIPTWPEVKEAIKARSRRKSVSIVLISSDWIRKGGPFAAAVVDHLNNRGIGATLRVIGPAPTSTPKQRGVEFVGRIDKWSIEGAQAFRKLLTESDFIIMPSRAEAYGMALWEGAAHGLPMIGHGTGGISSIIQDGSTGLLFSEDCRALDVANWIISAKSESKYRRMSELAYEDYLRRGNWRAFVDGVFG